MPCIDIPARCVCLDEVALAYVAGAALGAHTDDAFMYPHDGPAWRSGRDADRGAAEDHGVADGTAVGR